MSALGFAAGVVVVSLVIYFTGQTRLHDDVDHDVVSRAALLTALAPTANRSKLRRVQSTAIARRVESGDSERAEMVHPLTLPRLPVSHARTTWRTINRNGVDYRIAALPFAGRVVRIGRPVERSLVDPRLILLSLCLGGIGAALVLAAFKSGAQ